MNRYFTFFLISVSLILSSCGSSSSSSSNPITAPTLEVELEDGYKTDGSGSDAEWAHAVTEFQNRQTAFNLLGSTLENSSSDPSEVLEWDSDTEYDFPGNAVKYAGGNLCGIFVNSWWTQGDEPSFIPESTNPWKIEILMEDDCKTAIEDNITDWDEDGEYWGGTIVRYEEQCYEAKYWTQGDIPEPDPEEPWTTPWELLDSCDVTIDIPIIDPVGGGKSGIDQLPPAESTAAFELPGGTPLVPPVALIPDTSSIGFTFRGSTASETELPSEGYKFLRQLTTEHWDWLFPLRSGKYNASGAQRNLPPIAEADGSTDIFTLENFIKAVLAYNNYASQNGYKQFLNEGTLKQQAQEFIAFWAKSARETSGSWKDAPEPWIISYTNSESETTDVWTGGIYWTEENGYTSNPDGTSDLIGYVKKDSEFTPVDGRSYHGRGIIQLSWNYNYGPFSHWLYDNNLLPELITSRDILLSRPDYVSNQADLAMLSGVWFWMTPQGAKPSCHDVLYGDVYNISTDARELGLPPRNDGGTISAAAGDTTDEAVMAYRLGTIINIVNGGLECNTAASWHPGPMQRVSYFNAYTMYFNDQFSGLNATRVTAATNVWDEHVSAASTDNLKTATCYSQKSYYSW